MAVVRDKSEDGFYLEVAHALSGCQLVEQELKLYITEAFELVRKCVGNKMHFKMSGDDYANKSLEGLIATFKKLSDNESLPAGRATALTRRLKMSRQNLGFADSIVIEKSIRRFGVCPVLAYERDAPAGARRQLLEQQSKPLPEPLVFEGTVVQFAIDPIARPARIGNSMPAARSNRFVRHVAPC